MNWDDIIIDAAATDTGMRRSNNQDSFTAVRASHEEAWRQRGHVFMVADGMGAHAVGELASKMACDLIPHNYMKARTGTPSEAIVKAFREVSALIHSRASANRDFQGMGTTCSALLLLPAGALVAHVGDSRVYRIRDDRIDQLSFDHSLVWELVRRNHLTSEQANLSVPKNVITRSLGPEVEIEVDVEGPLAVELGDVYLLCSDGLSGPVDDRGDRRVRGQLSPSRRLPLPGQSRQPARGARQYHRPDRPHWPVGRSRLGRNAQSSRRRRTTVATARRRNGWRSRLSELLKGRRRQSPRRPGRRSSLSNGRMCRSTKTLVDRLDELDAQDPGASDRAGLVARLDRAGQPQAPGRRRPRGQESLGFAPENRRDHLAARPGRRGFSARVPGPPRRSVTDRRRRSCAAICS